MVTVIDSIAVLNFTAARKLIFSVYYLFYVFLSEIDIKKFISKDYIFLKKILFTKIALFKKKKMKDHMHPKIF